MRRHLRLYNTRWWQEKRIWELVVGGEQVVQHLCSRLRLSPLVAKVLWARGIQTPKEAQFFLYGTGKDLSDPAALPGMTKAALYTARAIQNNLPILVHGDYDADGICATALLANALIQWGGKVVWFLPNRHKDGYGVSERAIRLARQQGIQFLITVDCGTTAHSAIQLAKELGMHVIVIDHHEPSNQMPPADVIVNPKACEEETPFRDLCAAALALRFAQAVGERLLKRPVPVNELPVELAAIAIAADVVPLIGENRIIVREGLTNLRSARNLGLRMLMEIAKVKPEAIRSFHLGFILAPRLNAAGRMENPKPALQLLLTTNPQEARELAIKLNNQNRERQQEEEKTLRAAIEVVRREVDLTKEWVLTLASSEWHPGVIGIVAARLLELYMRPTFLIALKDDVGKGSARSIDKFPVSDALNSCRPLLINGGGHKAAGGFTIRKDLIPLFRNHLNTLAQEWLTEEDLLRHIRIDAEVTTQEVTLQTVRELEALEPTGYGNPKPVFLIRNAKLVYAGRDQNANGQRLIIRVQQGGRILELVGEEMAAMMNMLPLGTPVDICFTAEVKGKDVPVLDLQIVDLCPSGSNLVTLRRIVP